MAQQLISENMHEQHLFDARIRIAQHARKWTGNFENYYYLYIGIYTYIYIGLVSIGTH